MSVLSLYFGDLYVFREAGIKNTENSIHLFSNFAKS